jgi:hypothetical protein
MTLEEKLTALLRAICARSFSGFAPTSTLRPYVTYQQIGGEVPSFLDATVPSKENATIQISVWSDTSFEAKALIKQIEAAMITSTELQASPLAAAASDFDADIPVYSNRQDFSVWADR